MYCTLLVCKVTFFFSNKKAYINYNRNTINNAEN